MISVEDLSIGFGGRKLFDRLAFVVRPGERLSLAGPNGAGKSTLMKILIGVQEPDGGKITTGKHFDIGYLPQEGVKHSGRTLFAEAETAFQAAIELQGELDALGDKLGELPTDSAEYAAVLEDFGELQLRLDAHDISQMKPKIDRVLGGLGFPPDQRERETSEFSGGWQMRIALAKLLLREPDLLLLDEPTNHLDIETVQWLESYLKNYPGGVILISHDRRFLDELTNRTLAFENGKVANYAGNYTYFLKEREARRAQLERSYRNQQKEIAKEEALINRFRAKASKASMVQSRIKQLAKVERIELEVDAPEMNFRFPQPPSSGQKVLVLEGLTKSYGDGEPVLKDLDFTMEKGDKIAIVGVNGAGKSTFSRIMAGVEEFDSGERIEGHHVDVSYFAQDHADSLDGSKTVLETATLAARGHSESEVRGLLGCFLFRGDAVFKQVSVLSGGERSRLALARMLMTPANTLIMDEPTNHLDMLSQDVLRRALDDFSGSYFIVSHNRDFLDPIVNKVLEFIPGQPALTYYGNVSDYLAKKKADEESGARSKAGAGAKKLANAPGGGAKVAAAVTEKPAAAPIEKGRKNKAQRRQEAEARQAKAKELKPLKEKLAKAEEEIAECEKAKVEISALMNDPDLAGDGDKMNAMAIRFKDAGERLERAYSEWGTVTEKLERLEG